MKNKKIEVDGWFSEKVLKSFVDTAKAVIYAKNLKSAFNKDSTSASINNDQIQNFIDGINGELWAALNNSIKVMSCLNDPVERDTSNDAYEIFDKEEEGLANVLIKHGRSKDLLWLGLSGISTQDKIKEKEKETKILGDVKSTIHNSTREVRTEVFDKLWKLRHIEKVKQILNLLEPVTNGEKDWAIFQDEVQSLLTDIASE